jgi:hypothetical protein
MAPSVAMTAAALPALRGRNWKRSRSIKWPIADVLTWGVFGVGTKELTGLPVAGHQLQIIGTHGFGS